MMNKEINIRIVGGLLGFEEIEEYILKPIPNNPYYYWLESQGGPKFLLTKANFFFRDYKIELPKDTLDELCPNGDPLEVYNIITVPERVKDTTVNLLAPLIINKKKGVARQVVLYDSSYTTRHYLFTSHQRRNCG